MTTNQTIIQKTKESLQVYTDEKAAAFLSENPCAKGHIEVYPDASTLSLTDLDEETFLHLISVASFASSALFEGLGLQGTNIILQSGSALKEDAATRVLGDLQAKLSQLSKFTNHVRDVDITDIELAEKHFLAVKERSSIMGGAPGILTGFDAIDKAYPTGMAPGHLIVAIGWPGRGKTWFTSYLACKAWEQGFKPMIVSLEMSPENMRDRIYTMMGSGLFKASELSTGDISIDDFKTWSKKKFEGKNSFVLVSNEGMAEVTPATIQGKIDQHKPDLVILDYHQLFSDNKKSMGATERNMNISREFKMLAMTNNIPVIDITAATADDITDQDNPPMMSQVAWSKAIEYDADMAIAIHKYSGTQMIEVVSRKNRHGSDFGMFLDWDINRGVIKEIHENPLINP